MTNSDVNDYRQSVEDFFSVLKGKLKSYREVKRHLDRFLSTDFNIFACIKPDEKRLSNVIANLLDPASSHGQQGVFLDAFLRRIGKDDLCNRQPHQVTTEYRIEDPEGWLDVLVDFGAFGIAIENKPWAKEGDKQLLRYSDYLSKKYNDQFCLIYLTLSGDKPDSIDGDKRDHLMKQGKLLCISYHSDILEWLRECCQLCESDKFRGFLRDFMNYIPTMEGSMSNSSERKMIVEHALENKENLEIALDVNSAFNGKLNEEIIRGFLNKLEEFVLLRQDLDASKKWCVNNDHLRQHPLKERKLFSFGKESWGDHHGVVLEPASDNACNFAMGVWKNNDPKPIFNEEDRLREKLTDLTADFANIGMKPSEWNDEWWVWHSCLTKAPYQHWNTKEALIKLHNDEKTVHDLGSALVKIIKAIDEHVRGS